ncbi:prolipoprotein diacylglyceryl transferase [Candidatus Cytomitobacter primus]|uniref:Phosphatidylglycerol--prolipoprotein diacylglyceryl transferase n=1 Tax=Candidatus Cytomitobacter primus TaxID=2066024 RepID=A0A5C0UHB6_9PROT|nr:prolipoprotein diacylglyceryl transferase [Candidatus Cytomitobacter primus]QEK38444.1 prolipoprotein diacylglyceryl transferase [Candidatus Cytomitobacter primus]
MDPVAFTVFSIKVHWYGIAYFTSFLIVNYLTIRRLSYIYSAKHIEKALSFAFLGMIIGGRLGYIMLYEPSKLLNVMEAIAIWNGGMAAYGGFIGGISFLYFKSKLYKIKIIDMLNTLACYMPIALFFGRVANWINNEIPGKVLYDNAQNIIFHHPVILYSILFEGVILYFLINFKNNLRLNSITESNLFFISYGVIRLVLDYFRAVESSMFYCLTYGQVFSIMMIIFAVIMHHYKSKLSTD